MNSLVALIRFGLFGADIPEGVLPTTEEGWRRLFDLSRRQAVTALAYDAILKLPQEQRPPRRILFHFTSMTQTIEADNRRREEALEHFAGLMERELSLPTVVVKGSSLAQFYPNPLHRECGDNDLYTGADTERVAKMMEARGVAVDRKDPRHITFSFESVTFECHNYLLYHNDDIQWRFTPMANGSLLTLEREQQAFFLAKHCEHHAVFFHDSVRLRSLLDWCLLLGGKEFDYAAFQALKQGTDVDIFADLMSCYCNSLFGVQLPYDVARLKTKGVEDSDFDRLYMQCPERSRWAAVRVVRRSWKYLRYRRQYRAIYGQSMFRRFYFRNLGIAIRQHI